MAVKVFMVVTLEVRLFWVRSTLRVDLREVILKWDEKFGRGSGTQRKDRGVPQERGGVRWVMILVESGELT